MRGVNSLGTHGFNFMSAPEKTHPSVRKASLTRQNAPACRGLHPDHTSGINAETLTNSHS